MTLWWANNLKSKDSLKVGQKLIIPPVDGTVHIVKAGETLAKIADAADVPEADIISFNGLASDKVSVGQTLILPGGHGKPIPTPKARPRPVYSVGGGGGSVPQHYGGGQFAWPVPGGYISQYFHYGHPALDIAAPYGTRVIAAAAGTVIFAGWKSNGGGYQVWIAHGSGLYTTYNHMSAITVGVGQPSVAPSRSGGSASPAGRPGRTSTSRSGAAVRGRAAPTASTRSSTCSRDRVVAGDGRRPTRAGARRRPRHRLCDDPDDVPRPAEDPRARR